jgi:hypothetical protein
MPVLCDPCREPLASGWELLTCGAPQDAGHAVPIWGPAQRASQPGDAPRLARVKPAAPAQMGVLWCLLEVAWRQPCGPHPTQPFRVLLPAAGTYPVIRLAAPPGCSPTAWFSDFCHPEGQGLGPIDLGEDGRDRTALGRPRLGLDARTSRVHHTCLPPWTHQGEQGPVVDTPAPHGQEPWMVPMHDEAFDRSLSPGARPAVLAVAGAGTERLARPSASAIAVAALQNVLLRDGCHQLRTGPWPQVVFEGGYAAGPGRAVGFRHVPASDPWGPVALCLHPLPSCRDVAWPVGGRGVCRPRVAPPGRCLMQVVPAVPQSRGISASGPIAQPVSLVRLGCVGSAPQAGWLRVFRSHRVRPQWPVRAVSCRHVLPRVVGFPHRGVLGVLRLPRGIPQACPLPVLLRLPGAGAAAACRCQPGAVAGLPLPCLTSGLPYAVASAVPKPLGPPKCFDAALPAGHGRRTPADLHHLASSVARVWPAGACTPSASAMAMSQRSQHCRVRGHPGGLQAALATLRPSCAPRVPPRLRHGRKTRYGWVARPYPTRTCTLPETPSLSWRENARRELRRAAGARHERTLEAVSSSAWFK